MPAGRHARYPVAILGQLRSLLMPPLTPSFSACRGWSRFVHLCCGLACLTAVVAGADEPAWRVGVARANITPDIPVWLAGYGSKREPDGTLHDLWAKALAFEAADGGRAVLITSDFQGVPASMSDRVFARLEAEHGLDRSRVMFTFSHNHCGPRLGDDLIDYYPVDGGQEALVERYTATCVETCVGLVGQALASLAPATIRVGAGRTGFAVNRRDNREVDVPEMLARGEPLRGATDHTVPVLTVTRSDGRLAAVLFGYACHPTVLSFNTYCGDYPGFAQLAIERSHPDATALFVNTCGGDQNPLPRRRVELCERYGLMLAAAVEEALRQPMQPVACRLRTAFEMVPLDYDRVVNEEDLRIAAEAPKPTKARWARRMLAKLAAGETFASSYPYPIHAWRLGADSLLIGMGGETVVDYALRFKRQWGPGTWVLGYTDDMAAYIPSRRVWDEGGYEGGSHLFEYGRPAFRWAGGVEDTIAAAVQRLVDAVSR
jgi:neutral ceramidase